jgi:hypothetical protein
MKYSSIKVVPFFLVLAFFSQCFILFSEENILSAFIVTVTSLLTFQYLFGKTYAFKRYPLSALTIFGLNISTQSGALLYQSFTWTPLNFNLFDASQTFFYLGLLQLTAIISHWLYIKSIFFRKVRKKLSFLIVSKLGFFKFHSPEVFYFLGFVGLFSIWFSATETIEYGDVGGKFLVALIPFTYAPYLMLLKNYFLTTKKIGSINLTPLIIYTIMVFVVAFAKNSRGIFALVFMTVGLIILLYVVTDAIKINITRSLFFKVLLLIFPILYVFSLLSDFSLAMVIVRSERAAVSGWDLITLTYNTFMDDDALNIYRKNAESYLLNEYNETYISNPIFARLITVKFDDNMIQYYNLLTPNLSVDLLETTIAKLIALLPTPIINFFGMGIDKEKLEFSIGDYIYYLSSGYGLGGYRTGSIVAHGLIIFGPFFYVIMMFIVMPIVFVIFDSFLKFENGKIIFSPFILLISFQLFTTFNGDGLNNLVNFFMRSLPQLMVIYILLCVPFLFISSVKHKR